MAIRPSKAVSQLSQPVRFVWGIALCVTVSANPVLAGNIVQLSDGNLGPQNAHATASTRTKPITKSATKLTLGLDTLNTEFQTYQQAVTHGTAVAGAFISKKTVARIDANRVVIDAVAADDPQALKTALEALGAEVTGIAGRVVSARLPLDRLPALENLPALQFARPAWATTRTGAVTSQGDEAQSSDLARLDFGIDGAGSTVGVLSDSFDCLGGYSADITSGDLPAGINILDDTGCPATDEGRAMAQIVTDVAPGAMQAFHTAFGGEATFAQGILDLAAAGSTIIVDDVLYFAEPMFQDGIIAQAVDQVDALGIPYFSAAGNNGREAYEAPFIDSGLIGPTGGAMQDFDPGPGVDTRLEITQNNATTYLMQWADPFFSVSGPPGASTDLDICFYNPPGAVSPFFCSAAINTGGDPIEGAVINGAGNLEISIERSSGPDPDPVKLVMFGDISFFEPYTGTNAGSIYGHANAVGANAVGASAYFLTPAFFEDPPVLNDYSSAGNTPVLFDTAGKPILELREKPEFTAPDGGNNTFFGFDFEPDGWPNFFGTSAAAPHAAAVAALMRESDPALTPAAITTVLQDTAIDILERETLALGGTRVPIGVGYDNDSGSGLINAQAAVAVVASISADLTISKTDDIDPIVAGNPLTYTVTVSNSGPGEAVNVVVTDILPAGVTFVSTSGCAEDPNGVPTCSLGNIANGANASYSILVNVRKRASGTIINQARVTSDTLDPNLGDNRTTEDTTVIPPSLAKLAITKSPAIQTLTSGDTATFTIEVSNTGNVVLTDITVVDPNTPDCDSTFGTLVPAASASYTCSLTNVTASFVNEATVTGNDPQSNEVSASDTAIVEVGVSVFGDQDGDGCIGREDVKILRSDLRNGTTDLLTQDINGDGVVNRADIRALIQLFTNRGGRCP